MLCVLLTNWDQLVRLEILYLLPKGDTESLAVLGQRNPDLLFIGEAIHRFLEKGLFGDLTGTRESL